MLEMKILGPRTIVLVSSSFLYLAALYADMQVSLVGDLIRYLKDVHDSFSGGVSLPDNLKIHDFELDHANSRLVVYTDEIPEYVYRAPNKAGNNPLSSFYFGLGDRA